MILAICFPSSRPIAALEVGRAPAPHPRRSLDRLSARAQQALAKLEDLIAFPPRARMPNLLIVGASGMGKTMIVEKFARDHPALFRRRQRSQAHAGRRRPDGFGAGRGEVLQAASGGDRRAGAARARRWALLESVALRVLEEARPGMLVIDEVHSLQAGTVREQARFLNMLRFLGNELRIPLVCVGTQQARNALQDRRSAGAPLRGLRACRPGETTRISRR